MLNVFETKQRNEADSHEWMSEHIDKVGEGMWYRTLIVCHQVLPLVTE